MKKGIPINESLYDDFFMEISKIFKGNDLDEKYIKTTTDFIYSMNQEYSKHLNQDQLLEKLTHLKSIKEINIQGAMGGCIYNPKDVNAIQYDLEIRLKDSLSPEEMEYTLVHEFVHMVSTDNSWKMGLRNKYSYNYSNEILTEFISRDIYNKYISDIPVPETSINLNFKSDDLEYQAEIISKSNGYQKINHFADTLMCLNKDKILNTFFKKNQLTIDVVFGKKEFNDFDINLTKFVLLNSTEDLKLLTDLNKGYFEVIYKYIKDNNCSKNEYIEITNEILRNPIMIENNNERINLTEESIKTLDLYYFYNFDNAQPHTRDFSHGLGVLYTINIVFNTRLCYNKITNTIITKGVFKCAIPLLLKI